MANNIDPKQTSPLDSLDMSKRVAENSKKKTTLGQDDFLKLMLTQMQYQDPMKPMDNGEMVAQMAQFSAVAGLQQVQKSIDDMSTAFVSNQALQASSLVGRYVLVPSETGVLSNEKNAVIPFAADLSSSTDSLTVEIQNDKGVTVRHMNLGNQPAGMARYSWDGLDDGREKMPPGEYKVIISAHIDGKMQQQESLVASMVESVTLAKGGKGMTISVAGIGSVGLDTIREIL